MTRLNKFRFSLLATGFLWPGFIPSAQAIELNLYAGPQSITPREMIHVTVQSSVLETVIELSYNSGNRRETQTAITKQGLISFAVPAQETVGQMRFTAQAGHRLSNTALISVLSGPPQSFKLNIKTGTQAGIVEISSNLITDEFENAISDQSLVSLDWIDDRGLNSSQNSQLNQGRLILKMKCPSEFEGTLRLRAAVSSADFLSSDISSVCRDETHMEAR